MTHYLQLPRSSRFITHGDEHLRLFDTETRELVAEYPAEALCWVSLDERWLVTGHITDCGNSQDESISIYYIGDEGLPSAPDEGGWLSSGISSGYTVWFDDKPDQIWIEGVIVQRDEGGEDEVRQCYRLSHKDGLVDMELLMSDETFERTGEFARKNVISPVK